MQGEPIFFFFFNHSERLSRWPSKQGVLVLMFPCQTAGLQIDLYCTPNQHPAMNPLLSFCASLTFTHTHTHTASKCPKSFSAKDESSCSICMHAVTNHVRPLLCLKSLTLIVWCNSNCTLLCFSTFNHLSSFTSSSSSSFSFYHHDSFNQGSQTASDKSTDGILSHVNQNTHMHAVNG